MNMGNK
ncbi:Protein of unknown function [Lactobacillus helveticus CIRM-BIA 953]|nr:Protein of unknown function [Lactobacillus helveticus CIRM-BIA 953]CDI63420.1 Protein of unknown function [Lactobacillus helveticus CIRM-BIA 103]